MGPRAADAVLHGGKVSTVDPQFSIAQAVAITGNRIVFVGSSAGEPALPALVRTV